MTRSGVFAKVRTGRYGQGLLCQRRLVSERVVGVIKAECCTVYLDRLLTTKWMQFALTLKHREVVSCRGAQVSYSRSFPNSTQVRV